MQDIANNLRNIYEDSDNSWKEEIELLSSREEDKDSYTVFYERLNDITNYHCKREIYSNVKQVDETPNLESINDVMPSVFPRTNFSGEEALGRYLDLHAQHIKFMNSKFGNKCCYADYVKEKAWSLNTIAEKYRTSKQYISYLSELVKYLESFYHRSKPLGSLDKIYQSNDSIIKTVDTDKETLLSDNNLLNGENTPTINKESSEIDFTVFNSSNDLESLGGDKLKMILESKGLKSGGSTRERAERLWKNRSVSTSHEHKRSIRDRNVHLKKKRARDEKTLYELKLAILHSEMKNIITRTFDNIIAKSTKTREEIENEIKDNDDINIKTNDEELMNHVVNPLKLPLGPDGKPIPYWLYKLHGLNRKFECEICGNFVYEGRRAYEKHFNESRHQRGMQALGIPNSRVFYEISKINEANDLWNSLKDKLTTSKTPISLQEFEDNDGNLYDKETYELLKKQGLL
jgi:splicing factor 3A subunit 3